MAKRAPRKRERGIRLSEAQMRQPVGDKTARVEDQATVAAPSGITDLNEEYRYVTADLARIAIIAGVMLAVLVALALALP